MLLVLMEFYRLHHALVAEQVLTPKEKVRGCTKLINDWNYIYHFLSCALARHLGRMYPNVVYVTLSLCIVRGVSGRVFIFMGI